VFILEIIRTDLVVLFSNISMSSGSACSSDGSKKGPGAPRHPVWDHFELTDRNKSNRYTANCNFCNIAFPDARLDNIKKHILAECKDVPSEVRSTVQDEISKEASAPTLLKTAVRKAAKRSAQSSLLDSFDTRAIGPQVQKDLDFSVLRLGFSAQHTEFLAVAMQLEIFCLDLEVPQQCIGVKKATFGGPYNSA